MSFIDKCRPTPGRDRVPVNIDPDVRTRLNTLLWRSEFRTVGYSAFINRACEIAEREIETGDVPAERAVPLDDDLLDDLDKRAARNNLDRAGYLRWLLTGKVPIDL